jgi:DNA-binding CsgD family transcriptional regulator
MMPEAQRTTVFGSARRSTRCRTDSTLRTRVRMLRADVCDALQIPADALVQDDPFEEFTPESVSDLARLCIARTRIMLAADGGDPRPLLTLAADLQQLALELHQDEVQLRTRRLGHCADGLSRLRTLPTSHDLMEAACRELVERCDFGRAVISRVDSGSWIPMIAHFADADASWFADFAEQGIALHGLSPEARMLTERLPAVVHDTATTAVHQEIIVESGQSSSYVVAPLMADGAVVGFLHADHFPACRQVEEADRDVLWTFAAGFTLIHERMVLAERVQAQRTQVEQILGSALRGLGEQDRSGSRGSGHSLVAAQSEALAELTARETQVLHLIVEGATNQVIATRLVIAQDTVKSHVKQILRKLNVSNRAQVIACAAGTALD